LRLLTFIKEFYDDDDNDGCSHTMSAAGKVDVTESFSVSMEVLAHPFSHDGVLFSISWTPNFSLTAPNGEYLILEFIHSSVRTALECR